MGAFEDGYIDEKSAKQAASPIENPGTTDDVRRVVKGFYGLVLSLTYNLERLVAALLVSISFRLGRLVLLRHI